MNPFWQAVADGVRVTVKVQPKSRRPGVQGRAVSAQGSCLRLGVTEAAEDGRANRATCVLMAEILRVPSSAVTVVHGQTSRDKTLHVTGDPSSLTAKLDRL